MSELFATVKTRVISCEGNAYKVFFGDANEALAKYGLMTVYLVDSELKELEIDSQNIIYINAKEISKTYSAIGVTIGFILQTGIRRNWKLVAIGGGVIQDVAGFIASILFRGVKWDYYPTTLLAQADSCIGSKTSINVDGFKNLVGTFYPPERVVIDTKFLETLPYSAVVSGMGEIVKYHILNGDYNLVSEDYEELIKYCLRVKMPYIEQDEFDSGLRRCLNYGHTFGHALETVSGYMIPHGQAVLAGMDIANYISFTLGLLSKETYRKVRGFIAPHILVPYDADTAAMLKALEMDKKNTNGELTCILLTDTGIKETWLSYSMVSGLLDGYRAAT